MPHVSKKDQLENLLNDFRTSTTKKNVDFMLKVLYWTKDKIELMKKANEKMELIKEAKRKNETPPAPLLLTRGEIWEAHLGINVGSEQSETRPVLIIQNNKNNKRSTNTIVAPITKIENRFGYTDPLTNEQIEIIRSKLRDTEVLLLKSDFTGNTLDHSSIIYLQNIREISKERLTFKIADINVDMKIDLWNDINAAICNSLGIE